LSFGSFSSSSAALNFESSAHSAPGRGTGKSHSRSTYAVRPVRRPRVIHSTYRFNPRGDDGLLTSARSRPDGDGDAVGPAWIGGGAGASSNTREKQVNARKPPLRAWRVAQPEKALAETTSPSTRATAIANTVGMTNSTAISFRVIAKLTLTHPGRQKTPLVESRKQNRGSGVEVSRLASIARRGGELQRVVVQNLV